METPHRAPAAGETPVPAAAESRGNGQSRWISALSEPELDLLISLKMLAVKQAETAGRPHLADAFDLRTLRALGVVLLDAFKERLKKASLDATVLGRLALSRDLEVDVDLSISGSDSEVFRQHSKDQAKPNNVKGKQKQMHDL